MKTSLIAALLTGVWLVPSASAQITGDSSGVGSTVVNSGDPATYLVIGGTLAKDDNGDDLSLFHSFDQFSLSAGETAVFDLSAAPTVESVFGRVTGGRVSNIDGNLTIINSRVSPDLYLLNPAGVIFGPNAQLLLPGSFLATSAERLTFQNGAEFSIDQLQTPSLLTVSTPIGLQMGHTAGNITVNGSGHDVTRINRISPYVKLGPTSGLQVPPPQTLALIGNGVELNGGVLTANSANLEIGGVAPGEEVTILDTPAGFVLDYSDVDAFADISLAQQSLANVSGVAVQDPLTSFYIFTTHQGRAQMVGRHISLTEGSLLLGQNGLASTMAGGDMIVRASETLSISGADASRFLQGGVVSETIGPEASGDIFVSAKNMVVEDGGNVFNPTFSDADSGQIVVQVEESLGVNGFNIDDPTLVSAIGTTSASSGHAGNVTISSSEIHLQDGGNLIVLIIGSGAGGDLRVDADSIFLTGRAPISRIPSSVSSVNFGSGVAGDLTINTRQLQIEDTATVATSSSGNGFAGNVSIFATEKIKLIDDGLESNTNSSINSAILEPDEFVIGLLGLDPIPVGDAGNVTIVTPELTVDGVADVSVRNAGIGDAGTIQIQSDRVIFRDRAQIRAITEEGSGGDIDLVATEFLLLRKRSEISTESSGVGDGGNISIITPAIIALENSDIFADAVRGDGGNIDIATQTLIGTEFRQRRTAESDITASSEFGLNGTVEIDGFMFEPDTALVQLPEEVNDSSEQIDQGCASTGENSFVASGRGGIPADPRAGGGRDRVWVDTRTITDSHPAAPVAETDLFTPLVEASSWQMSSTGKVQLLAANRGAVRATYTTCTIK